MAYTKMKIDIPSNALRQIQQWELPIYRPQASDQQIGLLSDVSDRDPVRNQLNALLNRRTDAAPSRELVRNTYRVELPEVPKIAASSLSLMHPPLITQEPFGNIFCS